MPVVVASGSTVPLPSTPAPPPPVESPWHALEMAWAGWDGSLWPITDPSSGVFLTSAGLRGLGAPPPTPYLRRSPALFGATWAGYTLSERSCFWPLLVYSDVGSQEWIALDSAFWRTMHPARTGVWTVRTPDGGRRSLRCRYAGGSDAGLTKDPVAFGWGVYGVELVAEWPFWQGDPLTRTFPVHEARDFLPPAGADHVVFISAGSALGRASMTNPGDVPAYVEWEIAGPAAGVTVGAGGTRISYQAPIPASGLRIYTDPARMLAVDGDGRDRTDALALAEFAPVEPGVEVPLTTDLDSPGAGAYVRATLTPNYLRAW